MDIKKIYQKYDNTFAEIKEVLEAIVMNNEHHARWLNVLSYLEYIGSRKIFKTQDPEIMNETILQHASDEARHAYHLKTMIEKLNVTSIESYKSGSMLAGYAANRYFQSLDSLVKNDISKDVIPHANSGYICYLYVSLIIEIRANWMYDVYAKVLKKKCFRVQ